MDNVAPSIHELLNENLSTEQNGRGLNDSYVSLEVNVKGSWKMVQHVKCFQCGREYLKKTSGVAGSTCNLNPGWRGGVGGGV